MPPAPVPKPQRHSIYGYQKKRSVSPVASTAAVAATAYAPTALPAAAPAPTAAVAAPAPTAAVAAPAPTAAVAAPAALHASSSTAAPPTMSTSRIPRRGDEPTYFEEDYTEEITSYMTAMDNATLASAELMDMQPELQWFMRPYLIDFLIEVHQQFRLRPEVLYLAMNIVDRYVSKRVVYKKHYQLVGCAALWIAAKFEDGKDKVPLVKELSDMCCKAYDESAFIQMEGHVLSTIGWVIGHPTAEAWLRINTTGLHHEEAKVQHLARFLMEITLFHREFVGIHSSLIAAGALMLARFICGKPRRSAAGTAGATVLGGRAENVAVRVARAIDNHFAEKLEAVSDIVIRKYAPAYYSRSSTICREWYLAGRRFVYNPEVAPATPVSASGMATPGLTPSGSWSGTKRGSWMAASPSTASSMSCGSSDAGDEPITPITPVHAQHVHQAEYPFTTSSAAVSAAKENVAPGNIYGTVVAAEPASYAPAVKHVHPSVAHAHAHQAHAVAQVYHHQAAQQASIARQYAAAGTAHQSRAVLNQIHPAGVTTATAELSIPPRAMRRLSG